MIDDILKKIDENPIQQIEIIEDEKPIIISVDLVKRKEIVRDWLNGMDKKDLAIKYSIPARSVQSIIENNDNLRLDIERKFLSVNNARENYRLAETKNLLLNYIDNSINAALTSPEDEMTPEKKVKLLGNIAMIWDKLATTSRLNLEKPTQITETREIKADLSKIMEQLPTAEDKLNFLRQQSQGLKRTDVIEGQIIS